MPCLRRPEKVFIASSTLVFHCRSRDNMLGCETFPFLLLNASKKKKKKEKVTKVISRQLFFSAHTVRARRRAHGTYEYCQSVHVRTLFRWPWGCLVLLPRLLAYYTPSQGKANPIFFTTLQKRCDERALRESVQMQYVRHSRYSHCRRGKSGSGSIQRFPSAGLIVCAGNRRSCENC